MRSFRRNIYRLSTQEQVLPLIRINYSLALTPTGGDGILNLRIVHGIGPLDENFIEQEALNTFSDSGVSNSGFVDIPAGNTVILEYSGTRYPGNDNSPYTISANLQYRQDQDIFINDTRTDGPSLTPRVSYTFVLVGSTTTSATMT